MNNEYKLGRPVNVREGSRCAVHALVAAMASMAASSTAVAAEWSLSPPPALSLTQREQLSAAIDPGAANSGPSGPAAPSGTPAGPSNAGTSANESDRPVAYGVAGSTWLRFGALYASDFSNDNDLNLHVAWSRFLVDDVEFVLEAAGWYFNQEGQDTGGVSGSFLFRWHFWHAEDHRWTVFADVGIGLLAGFDEVPDTGTGFNFLPRAGVGFTRAFNESIDGESRGPRWEIGLRWHHISNGRISGDERNPARDSLAVYAGISIPF